MRSARRDQLVPPPVWTDDQLEADLRRAAEQFRSHRMEEPLEEYLEHFEKAQEVLEDLIESTVDFSLLGDQALAILTDPRLLDGFRYLAAPPISIDDLKTLADTNSLAEKTLRRDPGLVQRLVATVQAGMDRRRFPWFAEEREPTPAERDAAILATAALIATRRTETTRRTESKREQETRVRQAMLELGFEEQARPGGIGSVAQDLPPGHFTREVMVGSRKADIAVGLWDGRLMPIECKVSNSSTNSVKRINNDAAVKAVEWRREFGERRIVPCATLSGVYKLRNLTYAQERRLTIFWAHRLDDLTNWIEQTRSTP